MESLNIDLYESIVNGKLRPHLPNFSSEEKLKVMYEEARIIKTGTFHGDMTFFNEIILDDRFDLKEGDSLEIEVTDEEDKNAVHAYLNTTDAALQPLIDLDIPPPPDLKGEYFLFIIKKEHFKIKNRLHDFLRASNSPDELKFFAEKSIQLLKALARQAHTLEKKYKILGVQSSDNPNEYALFVLKEYLIRLLHSVQDLYRPFLTSHYQTEEALKIELYEYAFVLAQLKRDIQLFKKKEIHNFRDAQDFLNKGLFELEMYLTGKNDKIEFYNLEHGFKRFREELVKLENYRYYNTERFCKYWCILRDMKANVENKKYNQSVNTENKSYRKMIDSVFLLVTHLKMHLDKKEISKVDKSPNTIFDITHPPDFSDAFEIKSIADLAKDAGYASENDTPVSEDSFTFAFKGNSNLQKLNDLHDMLRKHKFISEGTGVIPFKKIFSGEKITKPVVWSGTDTDLHYFIILIHNKHKIVEAVKPSHWKVACNCFVNVKKEKFVPKKLKDLKLPNKKDREQLDTIVSSITPHPNTLS